jgi:hypothetical protein
MKSSYSPLLAPFRKSNNQRFFKPVIPAKAGIQIFGSLFSQKKVWFPVSEMTYK